MITLKSIQLLVGERLTPEAIANAKEKPPEKVKSFLTCCCTGTLNYQAKKI